MTWTPAAKIPGVTVTGTYQQFATTPPYGSGSTAVEGVDFDVDPSTGVITLTSAHLGLGGWQTFTLHDGGGTIAGTPEYPAINARLTVSIAGAADGVFHYDVSSRLAATHQDQITTDPQTQTSLVYDGTHFDIGAGSDGSFGSSVPAGIELLLELDLTLVSAEFWTENVNCFEDSGFLTKPAQSVYVPAVDGQPFIPASFNCYPPPPPQPPIPDPPPGGGGNGSGPPHGDCYYAPVYAYITLCHGYPPGDSRGYPPCLPTQVLVAYIQVCP